MKVLCINDDFTMQRARESYKNICSFPKEGWTYTVERIEERNGIIGYALAEVFGGIYEAGDEILWNSNRFIRVEDTSDLVEEIHEETKHRA